MKKKSIVLAVSFLLLSLYSTSQNRQQQIDAGNADSIIIGAGLHVVLIMEGFDSAFFEMPGDADESLMIARSQGTISIRAGNRIAEKDTLYLHTHRLQKLVLGENATVHTRGVITTSQLQLYLGAESKAHLRTSGKIMAHSTSDIDLMVEPNACRVPIEIHS